MPSTAAVRLNSLDWTPFKNDQNIIKSSWNNSIWNRKQVRIRVETTGELSVQVVAQNIFVRLASTLLKFFSRGQIKSFGKKVVSFTQPGYLLPKLDIPLSEKKQKNLFDLQTGNLALALLPSHKRLNELASELCDFTFNLTENPEVMEKVLAMHLEIVGQTKGHEQIEDLETIEDIVQLPEVLISDVPPSPKQKYLKLLAEVQNHILDLNNRCQFTSADWLENEMEKIIAFLSLKGDDEHALKTATENLEDALDSTEQYVTFVAQLAELPEGSPLEKTLKERVIQEIQKNLQAFTIQLNTQQEKLSTVFGSKENSWLQSLEDFFINTTSKAASLAKFHDSFESWIPGLQTGRHFLNPWLSNQDPLKSLEILNRHDLIKHHAAVEHFCKKALTFLEDETHIEKILQLRPIYNTALAAAQIHSEKLIENGQYLHLARLENAQKTHAAILEKSVSALSSSNKAFQYAEALKAAHNTMTQTINDTGKAGEIDPIQQLIELKKLASPYYDTLHQLMVANGKTQLSAYIAVLNHYQTMLNMVIPILTEQNNENLEQIQVLSSKISSKIAEATALMIDYAVRLHAWQFFSSPVKPNDLPPVQLYSYLEKVTDISKSGIAEITQDAAKAGFKFN